MTLLIERLKEISAFIYILVFLLIFNLFFNLNYSWYGISLIVRIYLFVVSFYLIFGFASLKITNLKEEYTKKYGASGEFRLFLESRIVPLGFIYFITILFTFIDYIRLPGWPWNPIVSLLNGRYSNMIIYSLFLFIILKLKREPRVTIPLFLSVSVLYFYLDKYLYSVATNGLEISAIKLIKLTFFFLIPFYEFFSRRLISLAGSLIISVILFSGIVLNFLFFYAYSGSAMYIKKESGLQLVNFGMTSAFRGLEKMVIKTSDFELFGKILALAEKYDIDINFSDDEWKMLLFSSPDYSVELISDYLIKRDVKLSYDEIISFVEKKSKDPAGNLENANKFMMLSLKYIKGNEDDLMKRMRSSTKSFKLWGMAILGEIRNIESIPLLIESLTEIDLNISEAAYAALKKITGLDPFLELNEKINNPNVIIVFKKYYLERRSSRITY